MIVDAKIAELSAQKLWYLTVALGAIWVLIAAYVAHLAWRIRRAEGRLQSLERERD